MTAESRRVGVAFEKICLEEVEKLVVLEQHIELCQFGFELQLELGDHLEEIHGIVSVDYHVEELRLSKDCEQQNPSSTGSFRTRNYLALSRHRTRWAGSLIRLALVGWMAQPQIGELPRILYLYELR